MRQGNRRQELLNEIIAMATGATEFSELLAKTLGLVLEGLGLEHGLALVGGHAQGKGVASEEVKRLAQIIELQLPGEESSMQVGDRLAQDAARVSDLMGELERYGLRALLAVTVPADGRKVGCLAVFSRSPHEWQPSEVSFLQAAARQLGAAASRLDLFEALHEQAAMLQRILDTVSGGIFALDAEKRVLVANRAARQILASLAGVSVGEVIESLAGEPIEPLLRPREDGLPHEIVTEGPEKRIYELVPSASPEDYGAGGWTVLVREVTAIRRAQQRVQEQERQASVGQLAAGIAHDFNNIIAAIILYSDMLLAMEQLPEKARQRVETILAQAQRAATVTRQILDFSRQGALEPHPLDLVPLLKELLKLLERTFPETIRLRFQYGDQSYVVNSDPGRMQQVFMNIALFARDSMPAGGELVFQIDRFRVQAGDPPPAPGVGSGEWVEICIRHTGEGIPPEHMPYIFEPYFSLSPDGENAGLGMAHVRGIVEQHGGHIHVSSDPGEATQFCIYLPALPESALTGIISEQAGAPQGRQETILVVEDDSAMRSALCEMLEGLNYRILSAKNGQEALEIYRARGPVDLVLSDLVMPEMGGVALYEELSRLDPDLRMVVMTGYPLAESGRELLEQGIFAWVQKPLDIHVLAHTLRGAIHGKGAVKG